MSWADAEGGGYQLEKDGQVLAHVFSIGTAWVCNLRAAHAVRSIGYVWAREGTITAVEVTLPEAKAWAERQLG
jgi:hypothetical protein